MDQEIIMPSLEDFSLNRVKRNLEQLNSYNPYCSLLLEAKKDEGKYSISLDLGLEKTLIVNELQLASRYDRLAFAKYRCRNLNLNEDVFIFGFGLGDEAYYLAQTTDANIYILILNPGLFYNILGRIDNLEILVKNNVHFTIPNENFPYSLNSIIVPAELYIEQSVYNNLKTKLINIIDDENIKSEVNNHIALDAETNIKDNYEILKSEILLSENDLLCFNKEIAIVAPGPSLKENLETIRDLKKEKNITIITVDVALKFLLSNEIIPDVIVTSDSKITPEIIGDISEFTNELSNTLFIYCANTPQSLIKHFKCRKRFIINKKATKIIDYLSDKQADFIERKGSVLNLAVELSVKSKPKKILLFGTDFAFLNEQTHVGRANSNNLFLDVGTITVKCNDGKMRETVKPYTYYRYILEQTIQHHKEIRFDNYSKTGAIILGTNLVV